ncbi:dTDP-4-keto-6-deoxy-D-glucose epimerase [Actinomadura sp. KC06]|uniref:dTDP-4-dehydrorhamnose 3,5-epimerase family protein n=1 Tax=Actinomadura sp. KC06 TaxID=2530369 RepID=UPI001043A848|nr:dTDP-4-dehydrorhamnose 3,5-epimerase family protein [Actinomadura sp. KC06]TDD37574.1 dTDP-4-keto-6-deoxy-D-glucose epimerase [Actinomadura sp. KC06]
MKARELAVPGAFEFTPEVFPDSRGRFLSPYQEGPFIQAVGHPLFPVAQSNHSESRRGVVRGVHFTVTPPGTAKYVYCPRGRSLDIAVDLRVGSPTFGKCDAVRLDQVDFRAIYLPIGFGHAFVALDDDTVMSYLISGRYERELELAISVLDPELALPLPAGLDPILSERDSVAPTLAEAVEQGILPDYDTCMELDRALHRERP